MATGAGGMKVLSAENGVGVEGPNLIKQKELDFSRDGEDLKDGGIRGLQAHGCLQVQQPQQTAIRWERFLHVASIKVLLVENDDSTRHVVTALLRNCNYEVVEAANGAQAWRILEDLTNHIDIILTEVVMPTVSGIGLLCKIMSHRTRKNIPVIMMSSHDSMGLVFKCLSKGAVDFLVKPIRKNELKNLWQHVWRRCHSSSGSGSESGTHTHKSIRSKRSAKSDNNGGSNDEEDNGSNGLNVGDGSDDGSGTQSSWTKQMVEVDSTQATPPFEQVADRPDSTCAQVIRSNAEISGNKRVHMTAAREYREDPANNVAKSTELGFGLTESLELQSANACEAPVKIVSSKQKIVLEIDSSATSKKIDERQRNPINECRSNKHKFENTGTSNEQIHSRDVKPQGGSKNVSEIKDAVDESKDPAVELSFKRLRGLKDCEDNFQDDRNVLRRSELSAFSRYNTSSSAFRAPNGITGSSTVIDNGLEIAKKESPGDVHTHSDKNFLNGSSIGVSNDIDMGSSTNKLVNKLLIFKENSKATSSFNGLHPASAFKPVKNDLRCTPQQVPLVKPCDTQGTTVHTPKISDLDRHIQHHNHHHYHHHHHHHHHYHNFEQQQTSKLERLSGDNLATDVPQCRSTNCGAGEANPGNHSGTVNGNASGSKHGSNEQNVSSADMNTGITNGEIDTGIPGKSGSGEDSGDPAGRVDSDKLAQRQALLTRFREKRKERCFKKTVRYHNRKRLAEQRPRVRGQFVRQTGQESASSAPDE